MQIPDSAAAHAKSSTATFGRISFDAVKRIVDVIIPAATAKEADLLTSETFISCAALSRPR